MINPNPCHDRDHQPATPMTFTIPCRLALPRPMALELLDELAQISSQAEAVALQLRRVLSAEQLEQLQPGASATVEQVVCRLETAAGALRGLC